jgi:hypothetical protein
MTALASHTRTGRDRATGELNTTTETLFGITPLLREQADAKRLLPLDQPNATETGDVCSQRWAGFCPA